MTTDVQELPKIEVPSDTKVIDEALPTSPTEANGHANGTVQVADAPVNMEEQKPEESADKTEVVQEENSNETKTEKKSGFNRFTSWFSKLFSRKKKSTTENTAEETEKPNEEVDETPKVKEPSNFSKTLSALRKSFSKKKKQKEEDKEKLTEGDQNEDEQAIKDPNTVDADTKEETPVVDPASTVEETEKDKQLEEKAQEEISTK